MNRYLCAAGAAVILALIGLTAPVAAKTPCEELHSAAFAGDYNAVVRLVDQGTSLECRSEDGSTPLFKAVMGLQPDVVSLLLRMGANVNARGNYGGTALSAVDVTWMWALEAESESEFKEMEDLQEEIILLLRRAGGTR